MSQTETAANSSAARIAELNDLCRKGVGTTLRLTKTQGIAALPIGQQMAILQKVVSFNSFEEEDDPYAERDFGAFTHNEERIFWKIDYYDPSMEYGSNDPGDPAKTVRVLTIMLASKY